MLSDQLWRPSAAQVRTLYRPQLIEQDKLVLARVEDLSRYVLREVAAQEDDQRRVLFGRNGLALAGALLLLRRLGWKWIPSCA